MAFKKEDDNSIELLKEDIKAARIRNVYLFHGPEEYLKKYYLESIEKLLLQEELKTLNRVVLDGRTDARKILDNCETMPVFSEKKLVVVRNSGLFKAKKSAEGKEEKGKGDKGKGDKEELASCILTCPEYTCLVFYEEEIDKRLKAVDAVKKKGLVVEFPYQKPAELVKWVTRVIKSHKKEIDPMAASQLVDSSEAGMTELLNEISKVVLYTGSRPSVTGTDIMKVCSRSVKSKIFDLTDAVAEKNASRAIRLLDDMIVLREPLPKILFMLARQFRQVLEMKLLRDNGTTVDEAAKRIGVSPYAAGKLVKQGAAFGTGRLQEAIRECLALDVAMKTGKIKDRVAAEILVTKFSE
jgi:DNA polymerase III subunit delta